MKPKQHFQFSTGVVAFPICFILILWIIFWIEVRFGFNFSKYGIYPLTLQGLRGILLSPFIHGSIEHIYHNSLPLLVLSMALFYFYRAIAWRVIFWGIIISGVLTWCIGRPSFHIGASGLIYVLVSFIFFKGVLAKHYRLIALSLGVIFLYGSMIWYVFPTEDGISWEGHLAGLLTGIAFALFFRKQIAKPNLYAWQEPHYNEDDDPFLKHFDEAGNFIETKDVEADKSDNDSDKIKINYTIKKDKN